MTRRKMIPRGQPHCVHGFRLVKLAKRKVYLWKIYKNHPTPERHHRYKEYRNIFKSATRRVKTYYYRRKFSECGKDIKKTWMIVNSAVKPVHLPPSLTTKLLLGGKDIDKKEEIKRKFTSYCASVGYLRANFVSGSSSNSDFTRYMGSSCHKSFVLEQVTETNVSWILLLMLLIPNQNTKLFEANTDTHAPPPAQSIKILPLYTLPGSSPFL